MVTQLRPAVPSHALIPFPADPPDADSFSRLESLGIAVRRGVHDPDESWRLELEHPQWGTASISAPDERERLREALVWLSPGLGPDQRRDLVGCRSSLRLRGGSPTRDVMRDRKSMLRFARAVAGSEQETPAVFDLDAQRFWSRAALDAELAHDAPLDVEALYCLHFVGDHGRVDWIHTHGLAELGGFDVDVVNPHPAHLGGIADAFRAMAFAIVERRAVIGGDDVDVEHPGPLVRFVSVDDFERSAPARDRRARTPDEGHSTMRAVACDPGAAVRAASLFRHAPNPMATLQFSPWASAIMAERARATIELFASLNAELAPRGVQGVVKLAYEHRHGIEHLWFDVHEVGGGSVEGTLVNEPHHDLGMHRGDRGRHSLDRLTDWVLYARAGVVSPRSLDALPALRKNPKRRLRQPSCCERARTSRGCGHRA